MSQASQSEKEVEAPVVRQLRVQRPRSGLPTWIWITFAGVLGGIVFMTLNNQRVARDQGVFAPLTDGNIISSPPPLIVPLQDRETTPVRSLDEAPFRAVPRPLRSAVPLPTRDDRVPVAQPNSAAGMPIPVYDYVGDPAFAELPPANRNAADLPAEPDPRQQVSALILDQGIRRIASPSHAEELSPPADSTTKKAPSPAFDVLQPERGRTGPFLLKAGTLIPAVLLSPLDTAQGGPVRAMVSEDVRGNDRREIVIPKGSTLVGEFASGSEAASNRIGINWQRLSLPDGRVVELDFPATDKKGAPGIRGTVRDNKFGRLAGSILQTVLNAATFGLINRNADNAIFVGGAGAIAAGSGNQVSGNRRITLDVGTRLNAFATQDIDFWRE